MSLRKRIADSEGFNRAIARILAGYIRFAVRTSRWERRGFEELQDHLRGGEPAVMVLWHQRLIMAAYLFDQDLGKICSLNTNRRAGRMAGLILQAFGFETVSMSPDKREVALSREVLTRIRQGFSVGMATDGSTGPARQSKTFPIVWSRSAQKPIFTVAYSSRPAFLLRTWDRQMIPLPFSRGALVVRRWEEEVPRKLSQDETEALRAKLDAALDAVTEEADQLAGRRRTPRGEEAEPVS